MLKFEVTFKNGLLIRDMDSFLSLIETYGGEAVAVVPPAPAISTDCRTDPVALFAPLGGDVLKKEIPQCPSCLESRKVDLFWTCERCGERWSADTAES